MTITNTLQGKVRGQVENGISVFRGIPFAAPPTGTLRWMPPVPPASWTGVRDALEFANASPQEKLAMEMAIMSVSEPESEDCLYLNVWTQCIEGKRPVLLWIHGGGFYLGAGSQSIYDGQHLATRDVVVVTINYRMGPFGFVHLDTPTDGAIPATGNEGILDQVAALEWVRDNIANFGGDPDNVTIFGESAGGMSVASIMTMPKAKGLFHKAAIHSGPGHTNFSVSEAIDWIAEPMLQNLGDRSEAALRSASTAALQTAIPGFIASALSPDVSKANRWAKPVVDGEVITDYLANVLARGEHSGMPIMVGTTRDELGKPADPVFEDEDMFERLAALLPNVDVQGLVKAYRDARSARLAPTDARSIYGIINTHKTMWVPSTRLLDAQRAHGPAYHYIFDWVSPAQDGTNGAPHGIDIGFVFGTHDVDKPSAAMFGSGPAADALAAATMDAWAAFAHSGDPATAALGAWPVYGDQRETMMIGGAAGIRNAPFEAERAAWDGIATEHLR